MMPRHTILALMVALVANTPLSAQELQGAHPAIQWRPVSPRRGNEANGPSHHERLDNPVDGSRVLPAATQGREPIARVTKGAGTLPNDGGQVWREYDIRPFTDHADMAKPESAIVDWLLRETGTDIWFTHPMGLLSADHDTLTVYHTPQVQAVVAEMVDRFVRRDTQDFTFSVHLVTVANPNWRTKAAPRLRRVRAQTEGIEAWLLTKEDAAVVLSDLRKRTDFHEYRSPDAPVRNGYTHTIQQTRPVTYVRSLMPGTGPTLPGGVDMGQLQEGFHLTLSPLLSLDKQSIDAVIRCETTQLEKLTPVSIPAPTSADPRALQQVQVPQAGNWRLHERFRWPTTNVLLVGCGMVATPGPDMRRPPGMLGVWSRPPSRADALLFVECKGRINSIPGVAKREATPRTGSLNHRGRY